MAAAIEPVVMDEVVGIRALCPAPRGLIELIGEDADRERDGNVFGVEKGRLVLPVETRRRDPGVGQPVERDVVEDVVSGEIAGEASLQDLGDEPGLAGSVAILQPVTSFQIPSRGCARGSTQGNVKTLVHAKRRVRMDANNQRHVLRPAESE